jgi:tetratricopeptide (TPR) repeat protein
MSLRACALRSLAILLFAAAAGAQQQQQQQQPENVGPPNPHPMERQPGNPYILEGDVHYSRRQDKRVAAIADKGEIAAAVRAYDTASEAADSVEARWKLIRSLVFQGMYTDIDAQGRLAVLEKARRVSENAVGLLEGRVKRAEGKEFAGLTPAEIAETLRKDTDAPPTFYWGAVAWGQWALARGKEEATKLGAADKIRTDATILIALDPRFEEGGGYRVLGRLHDQAPRMVAQTDWISRDEALRNLRLAIQIDPANFANRLFLAEAFASGTPAERAEAVRLAKELTAEAPSPSRLIEELRLQEQAAKDLRSWK